MVFFWLMVVPFLVGLLILSRVAERVIFLPKIKGRLGEMILNARLRRQLDPAVYCLIPDITLPAHDGTTQIDHVVVSRYGIFVVETKTYTGWIFGSERDAQWTQSLVRGKFRFQNPLRQNYKHTKTLAALTGIPEHYFKPAVAFGGDCTFKTVMPVGVVYSRQLAGYIRSFSTPIIKDDQVPEIAGAILAWAGTVSEQQKAEHVARLHARHAAAKARG